MAKETEWGGGYTTEDKQLFDGVEEKGATVSLVVDKNMVMVVDPGTLENQQVLLSALAAQGLTPDDVTVVAITHSHIDHYKNIGMFGKAKVLEYSGIWDGNKIEDWQTHFSTDIQILKTPGHDAASITLFVNTLQGVVAICGDVFWKETFPKVDPYAFDAKKLEQSRALVLKMSSWIIPGHGPMYKTGHAPLLKLQDAKKMDAAVLGKCKKCRQLFKKLSDKCPCQSWLCYHCCECDIYCGVCHCKHKI